MYPYRKRVIAVFHFKKLRRQADFVEKWSAIVNTMEKRTDLYPSPPVAIAVAKAHIKALEKAQAVVNTGLHDSTAIRNQKYSAVCSDIRIMLRYVQGLADDVPDLSKAAILITSAGFSIKGVKGSGKPPLKAISRSTAAGEVLLIGTAAAKRAIYNWQMSRDGKKWVDIRPDTPGARTTVKGLPSETIWYFRYRSIVKGLESDWSAPVSVVVK